MRYRVLEHVYHREVDGEVVILDSTSDDYFGLNRTGAVVWAAIARGEDLDAAVGTLVERFAVDAERARADADAIVGELVKRGLIAPAAEG